MKLLLCSCFVLVLGLVSFGQDVQQTRLAMAVDYLRLLHVPVDQSINVVDVQNGPRILEAINRWRQVSNDKMNIAGTPPKSLIPSASERLLRVTSVNTHWAQTPYYLSGVPEGSPPDTLPSVIRNPNYALWSFGGTFSPSELYISIADRTSLCSNASKIWTAAAVGSRLKCDDPEHLSASRKQDVSARIGSAFTVSVNASQVPRFEGGIFLSQDTINRGRDYTFTVQGSFDPALMFRAPAELGSWGEYYHQHSFAADPFGHGAPKAGSNFGRLRPLECSAPSISGKFNQSCYERIARGPKEQQLITSILPKIDVKAFTAFNLYATGLNTFVPAPHSGRALYEIAGTWDLRQFIPSASARVQALQAAKSLTVAPEKGPVSEGGWKARFEMYYREMLRDPSLVTDNKWWEELRSLVKSNL